MTTDNGSTAGAGAGSGSVSGMKGSTTGWVISICTFLRLRFRFPTPAVADASGNENPAAPSGADGAAPSDAAAGAASAVSGGVNAPLQTRKLQRLRPSESTSEWTLTRSLWVRLHQEGRSTSTVDSYETISSS